jgi:hypothetical protein
VTRFGGAVCEDFVAIGALMSHRRWHHVAHRMRVRRDQSVHYVALFRT